MSKDAICCVAIDDAEFSELRNILSTRFGDENFLSTIVVRSNPHGRAMAAGFSKIMNTLCFCEMKKGNSWWTAAKR